MEKPRPLSGAGHRDVYSVSRLNHEVARLLQTRLPVIWVEGELSNLARPGSGHWYFSLKDAAAQVRCAMFSSRNRVLAFTPREGEQVLVRGRVGVYEPRGDYQLVVEHMEPAGEGALRRAFEQLKRKLDAEGLFAAEHKRKLPSLPQRIGVITSPSGAAIRDILKVLKRRFPTVPVIIYPVPVQGEGAAAKIVAALHTAERRADCDVLILTRGGGSLEDLWPFNEEVVARALHACAIPVVCGVGHEVDVSIADLVADVRAPTPSAAAELVVPDRRQWSRMLTVLYKRAWMSLDTALTRAGERLASLQRRVLLLHPARGIQQHGQRVDELAQRMNLAMRHSLDECNAVLAEQTAHLMRLSPLMRTRSMAAHNEHLGQRLSASMRRALDAASARLAVSASTLNAMSPLATLERGYAIIRRESNDEIIRHSGQVQMDEILTAKLARGKLRTRVIAINKD